MKSRSGEKIKLTSIDELLGVVNEESAMEIEINRIHAFKDHPFKVLDDEKMADLVEKMCIRDSFGSYPICRYDMIRFILTKISIVNISIIRV